MLLNYGFLKLSITFFYRRIFVSARGTLFDWATKITIAIVIMWTIGFVFATIFNCGTHVSAIWANVQHDLAYCADSKYFTRALVVSDLITDVIVLCLPLPVVSSSSKKFITADGTTNGNRSGTFI